MNVLYKQYLIDPASFKFSAKLVGNLHNQSGQNSIKKGDLLIAYSGSKPRGVGKAYLIHNTNHYIFLLTIFSNLDQELLNFKIKQAGHRNEVSISENLVFKPDSVYGEINEPYLFTFKESSRTLKSFSRNSVTIFPNPVYDKLHIQSDYNIQSITISEINGKCIKIISQIAKNSLLLKTNFLNSGVFFLKIETENGIFTRKLIKSID